MTMNGLTGKLETGVAGLLWAAASILLPMAALAPIDGSRATAGAAPGVASCLSVAVGTLRACPATAL
jgi:hypothetical protein